MEKITECREQIRTLKGIVSCKNCGADINVSDTFCSCCGTRIVSEATLSPDENQCPNCGGKVNPGQLFCTTCGMRLTIAASAADE
ncbi:MAG: zinc ribbon domain-containing protein [Clostridiales bacterium]|nr:zinc ribbon domain-containing protein [Clostridiales bacterium]